jgi:hypothetical protein
MVKRAHLAALLMASAFAPGMARADAAAEARLREALRTTTQQLRSAEEGLAKAKASEEALGKEMEAFKAQLSAAQRRLAGQSEGAAAETRRRLAEQALASAALGESLAKCEAAGRDSAEAARAVEGERTRLAAETKSLQARLAAAEAKNARMYHVGKSVIDWLYAIGVDEACEMREPFLGLKRVEMENAAQSYDEQLLEQKVKP